MSLLNLFNRFTRNFRKKKRRKTRRRKGAGQGTYSPIAKSAILKAARASGVPPRPSSSSESKSSSGSHKVRARTGRRLERKKPPKILVAKTHHTPPEKIMKQKTLSGRTSPPPQYPGKGPGIMGGGRKTRRRKGKGYSKIHKQMFKKQHCQRIGGRWVNGECKLSNPQAAQPGGGRRRRTRRRKKRR